jgi:hypothetical protein
MHQTLILDQIHQTFPSVLPSTAQLLIITFRKNCAHFSSSNFIPISLPLPKQQQQQTITVSGSEMIITDP